MKVRTSEGRAAGQLAVDLGRELLESKAVKDGATGAGVGAVVAVPPNNWGARCRWGGCLFGQKGRNDGLPPQCWT